MYATHQPLVSAYAKANPDNMADVLTFVIATIQQPFYGVHDAMRSIRKEGLGSRFVWGFKTPAIDSIQTNKQAIYDLAMNTWNAHPEPSVAERELMLVFSHIEGLGLAKGGFAVQLIFGLSGCLDSQNVARFNLNACEFKASLFKGAKQWSRKYQLLDTYLDIVHFCGGTAKLWDEWCIYVHQQNPARYKSAEHVSRIHAEIFGLV